MDERIYKIFIGELDELNHNVRNNFPLPEPAMRQAILQLANIFRKFLDNEYYDDIS